MSRSLHILRESLDALGGVAEVLLGVGVVERRWNRDRKRRIATMLQRERQGAVVAIDHAKAMAIQLAEIRALPEARTREQ